MKCEEWIRSMTLGQLHHSCAPLLACAWPEMLPGNLIGPFEGAAKLKCRENCQ